MDEVGAEFVNGAFDEFALFQEERVEAEIGFQRNGDRADREQCRRHVEHSIGVITALVPHIGYANASRIAAQALHSGDTVRALVLGEGLLGEAELDALLSPQSMLAPQRQPA